MLSTSLFLSSAERIAAKAACIGSASHILQYEQYQRACNSSMDSESVPPAATTEQLRRRAKSDSASAPGACDGCSRPA